jgi:peptide-methionine (R)-S-oxide reductase
LVINLICGNLILVTIIKMNNLTAAERAVIIDKHTEAPFSGEYDDFYKAGVYICRQCDNPLFTSEAKFNADCGWPAFDDCLPGSVLEVPDADGNRIEILCSKCKGHLGHVFRGEKHTKKDTRHCVNSLAIKFIKS